MQTVNLKITNFTHISVNYSLPPHFLGGVNDPPARAKSRPDGWIGYVVCKYGNSQSFCTCTSSCGNGNEMPARAGRVE